MLRGVTYGMAATALAFTGLWFVIGIIVLLSPLPSALDIASRFFVAWLLLFLAILGASGLTLIVACINGVPTRRRPARAAAPRPAWPAPPDFSATVGRGPRPRTTVPRTPRQRRSG